MNVKNKKYLKELYSKGDRSVNVNSKSTFLKSSQDLKVFLYF